MGARLLDLGCGPGFAALELAARVGAEGRVLAVDASERFIASLVREAGRLGIEQLTARVERVEELRLEPASLDGAFARWIFCFLPDPAPVIDRVVSGLCPGGRLVIWDYLNYRSTMLQPRSPAFDRGARGGLPKLEAHRGRSGRRRSFAGVDREVRMPFWSTWSRS